MKTSIGKIGLLAAVMPLHAVAAHNAALQSASRDVAPLTLLPGPNLTSPARAPQPPSVAPLIAPTPDVGTFRFVPATPPDTTVKKQGGGTLVLKPSSDSEQSTSTPPVRKKALPSPESLRFDNRLDAPAPPPRMQFTPAPKRD